MREYLKRWTFRLPALHQARSGLDQRIIAAGQGKKSRPERAGVRRAVLIGADHKNRQFRIQVMRPKSKVQAVVIAEPDFRGEKIRTRFAQPLHGILERGDGDGVETGADKHVPGRRRSGVAWDSEKRAVWAHDQSVISSASAVPPLQGQNRT